jgi:REP element-mobilizing transposase RayT
MPRQPRIHAAGAFYHVTLRGNHRQDIFFTPGDRELLEQISSEVIQRLQARIHAYCWMTNHVHLLVQVGDIPLGRVMLRIASRYARTVQSRFHTTEHLFERRYHALLIDVDEYLLEVLRYVHLNPVRARVVKTPDEYCWSSHLDYLGRRIQPWVTTDFILRMFHPQHELALTAYRRFIELSLHEPADAAEALPNAGLPTAPGSDPRTETQPSIPWMPKPRTSLSELIEEACEQFKVTPDALRSVSRRRQLTRVRAWIAQRAISLGIASLSEVARTFGRGEASLRESVRHHFDFP